ncbi:MAG TPA: HEAT repeat domain-containing protein [Labilithrix sp.]
MGFFDRFKKKSEGEQKASAAAKWGEAINKKAQTYDRQEAINELCKILTADAAEALLRRFTFVIDPSITDQEEKEVAYEGVIACGKEAIEPIRKFAAKAESLTWPMKMLKELVPQEELIDELLGWLAKWDTDYSKFIDPKLQILQALEDYESPKIREAVEPFLEDVNEPARFHAVGATLAQKDAASIPALLKLLLDEESNRVKAKVLDGFVANAWSVPEDQRDEVRKVLPYQFGIDGEGKVKKTG